MKSKQSDLLQDIGSKNLYILERREQWFRTKPVLAPIPLTLLLLVSVSGTII
jgi:hypothetical protein